MKIAGLVDSSTFFLKTNTFLLSSSTTSDIDVMQQMWAEAGLVFPTEWETDMKVWKKVLLLDS